MGVGMILKRIFDFVLSLMALIILFPILMLIGILVYFKLGHPIFFIQDRVGKDRRIFKIIKFRTMLNKTDKNGCLLPDDERFTRFGKILRSTSLDELPELINVIKGEMSIVGPRPLLIEYLSIYNEIQRKRHNVRPGITGWAQVNGRNLISWKQKFEYDVWYVENWSLLLDLKTIFITVYKVVIRHGISQSVNITMEKFNGLN